MITIEYRVQFKHDRVTFTGNFRDMAHFERYVKERNNFSSDPISHEILSTYEGKKTN